MFDLMMVIKGLVGIILLVVIGLIITRLVTFLLFTVIIKTIPIARSNIPLVVSVIPLPDDILSPFS